MGAVCLALPSAARAQPAPRPPFGQGTHGLRALLKQMNLKPLSKEEFQRESLDDPQHLLIIALGRGDFLSREIPMGLEKFLNLGGAVLVATDRELDLRLTFFGVSVAGGFVQIDSASRNAYRNSRYCPIVELVPNAKIPIFEALSRVATNRPSHLFLQEGRWPWIRLTPLARFPKECELQDKGLPFESRTFAAAGEIGKGRLLILADHSVFINDMLLQPDNDNFDLAYKAITWLTDGKRDRVLFVEDGEIVTNFNVTLKEPPVPPLPSDGEVIQAVNRMLAGLDRENYYNRQLFKHVSPIRLWQWLTVALTLGLAFVGCRRLLRARHRIDAKEPLLDAELHRSWPSREKE